MNDLILAAVQALLSAPPGETDLPRSFDPEWMEPRERQPIYPWLGIEPMAVWTAFDSDWGVKNAWGYGADAIVTLDYGTQAFLGFRAGYIGWNTRVHTKTEGDFGYRIRRDGDGDTAGFFEFEAMLGARPSEFVWVGIVGMQTFSSSNFNLASE